MAGNGPPLLDAAAVTLFASIYQSLAPQFRLNLLF